MTAVPSSCHPSALTTWIQKKEWCHSSSLPPLSSQCPDYLDPENLTLNKWLHNEGWIPDWNDIIGALG
ncbi:hypothetical protein [Wolbachia endosymbiont (group A) of Cheilosia soror]|uniref:hypothetical protein n=1 Tax=Wolbachia endosymbiont (group A) of Cheilosia soror TaxID=2953995 RepID=UPI0021F91021|nr:hypothetical protein [Wolbachia endosymbiont (group A) of Cheilosia soror]